MNSSVRAAGHTVVRRRDVQISLVAAAVIAACAGIVGAALVARPLLWTPLALPVAILLGGALLRPFEPAPGEKFSLGAAVAFFAASILPTGGALSAVLTASLVVKLLQRRSLLSSAVNTSIIAAATAAASLALGAVHGVPGPGVVLAGAGYVLVSVAGVAAMVGASSGAAAAQAFIRRELLPTAALVCIGAIGALLWERDVLAIALLAAPLALIEIGLRRVSRERAAQAALHAAHAAQQEFTEDAAHELRTPLTALMGNLAFIGSERLGPAEADALADAKRTVAALEALIGRLLVLSRSATPRAEGRGDLCAVARESVRRAAPRPGVQVRFEGPPSLEVGVALELLSVIVNDLLANAVAFTRRGSIVVRVGTEGATAVCAVADTGVGIPAPELSRVFDRFFRGRGAQALAPGTGLGLAIVRRIADAYGGSVTLTSAVEQGTTVVVRLPMVIPKHQAGDVVPRTPRSP